MTSNTIDKIAGLIYNRLTPSLGTWEALNQAIMPDPKHPKYLPGWEGGKEIVSKYLSVTNEMFQTLANEIDEEALEAAKHTYSHSNFDNPLAWTENLEAAIQAYLTALQKQKPTTGEL